MSREEFRETDAYRASLDFATDYQQRTMFVEGAKWQASRATAQVKEPGYEMLHDVAISLIQSHVDQQTRELRTILEEALRHVPQSSREVSRCIKVDPAGNTYEVEDAHWYLRARAALSNNIQEPLTGAEKKEEG